MNELMDLGGTLLGLVLTLFVFSYILGDNALFRIAIHIFIGVAAGFAAVMSINSVIFPQLVAPLLSGGPEDRMLAIIPLVLGILLLAKGLPRMTVLGTPVMAYLVGVGAAVAIGGALGGTLLPQAGAAIDAFSINTAQQAGGASFSGIGQLGNAIILLAGTLSTLIYFHFGVRSKPGLPNKKPLFIQIISWVGQGFIAITFGALFAGVYSAALTALVERWSFIVNFLFSFVSPGS